MTPEEVFKADQLLKERQEILDALAKEKNPGHWWQFGMVVHTRWIVGHTANREMFTENSVVHKHMRAALDGALAEIEMKLSELGVNLDTKK